MILEPLTGREYRLSLYLNQWCGDPGITRSFFVAVSRLGDGIIWYAIIFALPLVYGAEGLRVSALLSLAALSGVAIYKSVKGRYPRPRPYMRHADIQAWAQAMDEGSFPSGHTLHATSFLLLLALNLPTVALLFLPFAIATAGARIILGLHYPSDVAAGAAIGGSLGLAIHGLGLATTVVI